MQWSKIKSTLESFLCEKLKGRVQIHATVYRKFHDNPGRVWITFDKKEIVSSSHITYTIEHYKLCQRIEIEKGVSFTEAYSEAKEILIRQGLFEDYHLYRALMDYSSLSIEEALRSDNIIIQAYSMFDRRLGKRRIKHLNFSQNHHLLITKFYKIRCNVEGINIDLN